MMENRDARRSRRVPFTAGTRRPWFVIIVDDDVDAPR